MKKLSIPQLLLVTTTTTGCSLLDVFKSEAAIAEDLCTLSATCYLSDDDLEDNADEIDDAVEECAVSLENNIDDMYDEYPDCKGKMRAALLCLSNLDCDEIEDETEKCEDKREEANDCMYD